MKYQNIKQAKAIERKNKERLLKVNPKLNDESGIYFLTRVQPQGYIGQAKHILTRLAQHLTNFQHIDNSIRVHGFYSEDNPYGYKVNFIPFKESELDEKEQYYIQKYLENGYELKNKTAGGQGAGKTKINEFKPAKGYRDGLAQGRKNLARELKHIIDTHLTVTIRKDKLNNKVSVKALEKFNNLINEGNYKEVD